MDYLMRPYRYELSHGVCIMGTVSWSMPDGVCLMVLYLMSFISVRVIICYMTFNIDNAQLIKYSPKYNQNDI